MNKGSQKKVAPEVETEDQRRLKEDKQIRKEEESRRKREELRELSERQKLQKQAAEECKFCFILS